ncbi:Crp/Fnr family transcriptional regulator [Paenibacillus polygoni]|uniref:Crp/Fnr family transcriptional regulator n=1 Tax=Paenibacillus polygoni TaxID=3050112 RepID=A0ABY8X1E0_9BACL|nr:Crp/Fnr family transcriptional regulator [Paenibacillus polygoni]WIV18083.1 Crp/Fnr family transcriptional regulator [Paenibacillus polygoni]
MMTYTNVLEKTEGNTNCFSKENLNRLFDSMKERTFPQGSHLFWEGDTADKLFYIKKGRIKVTKSTDEGKELIMYIHQDGDMTGHADPFFSSRHSFSAEALEESEVGIIETADLELLIGLYGDFAIDFMKWMGIYHRITQTKFRDLMMYGKQGALCSTLIRLGNTYGEQLADGSIRINKKLTHTDLSNMIGATRESVNRMLGELRKKGSLAYEGGYIIIRELNSLREICRCEQCPIEICRI